MLNTGQLCFYHWIHTCFKTCDSSQFYIHLSRVTSFMPPITGSCVKKKKKESICWLFINYWPTYAQSPLESYSLEIISSISLSGGVNMNLVFFSVLWIQSQTIASFKSQAYGFRARWCRIIFPSSSALNLASLVVQLVKSPSAMQETLVWFLDREDLLKKG